MMAAALDPIGFEVARNALTPGTASRPPCLAEVDGAVDLDGFDRSALVVGSRRASGTPM